MFWILLASHMLLLTSNLKVILQQMWNREETFKELFLIFMGADRDRCLNSISVLAGDQTPMPLHSQKPIPHPKTSRQYWEEETEWCILWWARSLGNLTNVYFHVELSQSGRRSVITRYLSHTFLSKPNLQLRFTLEHSQNTCIYWWQIYRCSVNYFKRWPQAALH